jgi:hypothetical protein
VQGVGVQEGVGVAVAVVVGVAVVVVLGVAVAVVQLLAVLAPATPPSGPVKAANATPASRTTIPAPRPTSPTLCSFSQLLCRDRRKIVTISWVVRLVPRQSGP